MLIGKILHVMCASNEHMICWYRNVLCTRARRLNERPPGNLVRTKSSTSIEKYAKDCLLKSRIEHVFDKNKFTDQSKINLVEVRVMIQALAQRVSELEETLSSKDKAKESLVSLCDHSDQSSINNKKTTDALIERPHPGSQNMTPTKNSQLTCSNAWSLTFLTFKYSNPRHALKHGLIITRDSS